MTSADLMTIFSALAAAVVFGVGCARGAWLAKQYFDNRFSDMRKLIYRQNNAIRRIEFHLVKTSDYQPAVNPVELEAADKQFSNGNGH